MLSTVSVTKEELFFGLKALTAFNKAVYPVFNKAYCYSVPYPTMTVWAIWTGKSSI